MNRVQQISRLILLGICFSGLVSANGARIPHKKSQESAAVRLRNAINDMINTFANEYPKGKDLLKRLDSAEKEGKRKEIAAIAKEAMIANPLIGGKPILFVVRKQYKGDHHNTATLFQTNEINTSKFSPKGLLRSIDLRTGQVQTIVDPGKTGVVRDPEMSFDGKRIVFSMRKSVRDDYHIYEVNVDGTGLKQLTSRPGVSDFDPLYLPDNSIVFSATREPKYCMCNRHIMANLYRMESDGANIHQIGKSTLFEGHSSLTPDGRILYDRWEYVDRNFGDAQGLWTVNPDGTGHSVYYGNNTSSPGGVIDARIIPGTQLCLCIFGSCHDRPWGALAIIDRNKGVDGREPVVRTWPANATKLVSTKGTGKWDSFMRLKTKYEDPYPLSAKYFLVSRMVGRGEQMGIYAIDTFGNEVLLHTEGPGCYDPMPIASKKRPEIVPSRRNYTQKTGRFYVQNVYIGTHMAGVKKGEIKYLRIVESPEKRNWTKLAWSGQGAQAPGMNWLNFENKRILGTVPVEADGSAFFEVPADTYVFFQALDKNKMLVQSMRSATIVQSGEVQGCVGCHEHRIKETPQPTTQPLALKKEPHPMNGWQGRKPQKFGYLQQVQPIFTRHCVKCHDYGKKGAKKLVLAPDKNISFNASYIDLWARGYMKCVGAGQAEIQLPKSWGSHPSKLIQVLRKGHNKVSLSDQEMETLITWVDINGPYYPDYESAFPNNACGRSPLNQRDLGRLRKLTRAAFVTGAGNRRAQISFDRPEMSPCLTRLKKGSKEYAEALAIIVKGKKILEKTPRADMPGFIPCELDRKRNEKYLLLRQLEKLNREAIIGKKKHYDKGSQ